MKKLSKTLVVLCITFAIFGLFNVNFNESRICWGNDVEAATPTYSTYQTYQPGSQVNWENHVFNFTLPANAVVTNVSVSYWNIRSLMGPYGNIETKYNNNNDINTTAYFPGASKIVSINTDYNTGSSGIYYVSVDSGNYMRFVENATCTVTYKINHNPSVAISSPVQNQLVPGQFNLLYSFNDQDAGDRIRVYCSVDNVVKNELSIDATSTGSSQQISKMVDVSTLGAGSHTMTVWAVDNYNLEGRATVAFIKNYTPFIKIDTPTPNSCFSEIQGNNKIIVSGTFIDPDVGDYDTIYYSVDNNTAVKLLDGMTANSSYQYFSAAIDPSSITEGSHKLSFFVQDSRGGRSAQDIYIYIDRTVPSISSYTATALSGSISMTMNVSDTVGLGTSPYKFTVGSNTTGWINSNAYKQTSLLPNTTYNVELRTRDIAGHELFINKQICSLSETPSVFIDNISSSSAEINLTDNNPENTQYQIIVGSQYLSESGYLSSNPVWIKIPKKRIMLYNLNTGTSYSVQAKTQNAEGIQSSYSTVQTFKTLNSNVISLDKPQVTATKSDTSITLTWPDVNNSYGYDISKDNVQEYSISYPYTINGLKPGSIHKYRARAKNQNGPGPWSDELTVLTNGSIGSLTPQNVTAEVSDTSVKVIWDPLSSATSYEVILTAPDSTTKDYTTNDNFYLFTGINPNTQYQYKVRAFSNQTAGDWSSLTSVATLPSGIIPPSNFNATPSDSSIKLSWDKVAVATGYQIDIDGTIIDVSDNSYVQSSVQKDRIYSYRVRTKSNNLMSIWSNIYTCDVSDISFQRNCQSGEVFKFALTASNVRTFENRKIIIKYNTSDLDLQDLNAKTLKQDLDGLAGKRIPGSDLTLESYGSGVITLTTSKLVTPGKAWSGVVGLLSFKSKKTGTISISYKVTPLPSGSIMPSTVNYSVSSSSDVQVAMTLNGNALLGVKNGAASLNPLTDYNITGNVATIKSAYIQDYFSKNPQQNLSLVLDYSSGYDPILTICKSTENSTIVTNYGVYDRRVPGDLAVQLKLNGNRLNGIMNGTSSLILDSDYSVSGDTVTLKQSYLDKLPLGYGNTLTFTFSSGNSATYTLTVNGAAISPDTISYNVSSPVSIPVTMSSCNYDFKTVRNGTFDLVKDTDYAVSGNILTIKPGYFTYYFSKFPTQTLNLKFIFANPNTGVEYPVNFKATPAANDSSISPVSDCFDLSNQSDRNITINLNGNTLKTVKNSTYTLISGTDYSLSGNVLTLKASYLNTLACGNYNITFSFSAGKDAVLALTVNQSQVDSTITPLSSIFDLGSQYDIPVTMTLNGNSLLSVVNSVYTLSAGTDYVLSGNTVTIKSDYLKNLPVSDAKLKFVFSAGSNAILTIHINGGSINPSSLNYNVTQHPSVVITTSTSGYNFKTIRNGPADLVLNVDYTVSGNSITLKSSYFTYYFGKFPTQTLNLTFVFERSGDKVEYPVSLKVTPVTQ